MKKLLVVLALSSGLLFSVFAGAKDLKIAIVNFQKILAGSPKVQAQRAALEKKFGADQAKLKKEQGDLKAMMDKLHRDGMVMKAGDKKTLQDKANKLQASYFQDVQQFQQQSMKAQQDAMQQLIEDLRGIVAKIAKKEHYDLVLPTDVVAYSSDDLDITTEVAGAFK